MNVYRPLTHDDLDVRQEHLEELFTEFEIEVQQRLDDNETVETSRILAYAVEQRREVERKLRAVEVWRDKLDQGVVLYTDDEGEG